MAAFGTNLKLTISSEFRAKVRALFVDVLGAKPIQPRPDLDVFELDNGEHVGAFYVAAGEALSPADQRKGAWLEFAVTDADAMTKKIEASGITRIDYEDKTHAYFQIPGGSVFRLSAKKA